MHRPGTGADTYEDYQRDIERYQQRKRNDQKAQVPATSVRSNSLPPDFLGEERGIRSSQLTHLGGFRREYLHRKRRDSNEGPPLPSETDSNTLSLPPEAETSSQASLMLAAEIEDQMSYMAFLVADMVDDSTGRQMRLLAADALPGASVQKKKMSVAKACVSTFKAFIATGIPLHATSHDKCWLGLGNFAHGLLLHHLDYRDTVAGTMSPASQCVLSTFGQEGLWQLWLLSYRRASGIFSILLLCFILYFHQRHHSEPLCKPSQGATEHFEHHACGLVLPYTPRVDSSHRQNESGEPHW